MMQETARTIPFGIRVKLNSNNVVTECQGRHGTTLDPVEHGDLGLIRMLEANPWFNLVLLDGDFEPILMEDRSLDLVEFLDRCYVCEAEGGYIVYAQCSDGLKRSFCIDCHERNRASRHPAPVKQIHDSSDLDDSFIPSRSWREDFHADG